MTRVGRSVNVIALIAITFLFPLVAPPPHRIDDDHCDLIRPGMTEAEVAAIFGVPPGNYDWAVHDESELFPPALAVVVARVPESVAAVRGGVIGDDLAVRLAGAVPRNVFSWETETRTWVSRHGAYRIYLGEGGEVMHVSKLGGTRIQYPWHDWRRFGTRPQ